MSADCRLTVTVRRARDAAEIQAAMDLRVRVFCEEQGVSRKEELDGLDGESTHIVALDESGGYLAEGDTFLSAGLEHVRMRKTL